MGKRAAKDFITSTLGKWVVANQLTPTSAQSQYPELQEVYIDSLEEDDSEPVLLAPKKIFDYAIQEMNPPTNVYIY